MPPITFMPGVTINSVKLAALMYGGSVYIQDCSHNWIRVFVKSPEGVTLGRVSFYKEKVGGFKYYKKDYFRDVDANDEFWFRFNYSIATGVRMSRAAFEDLWKKAKTIVANDLAKKEQWRRDNPTLGKRRKKLQGKNPRRILQDLISKKIRRLK